MLLASEPTLRQDLLVTRTETPEGPRWVLKDPRTRRYFRLGEAEYAIARQLDGRTPLAELAPRVAAQLDLELDADSLRAFVGQLRGQGLLDDAAQSAPVREGFIRGTPLYLRFRAFDPDRLLDRFVGSLGFFFTPWFVVGAAVLLAWGIATVVLERAELLRDFARLWSFQSLLVAWLVVLFVVTLHEFAHAFTCKRFGGRVHEMGFMLIYFQPAFYCDVSDAWLFPRKSRRLWVTASGAFFELFVWSLAIVAWTVVEPGTWVSGMALIVIATSGVKQFFNLNPLIKLDGYYLLSDLLDAPNLRSRALDFLGDRVKRLAGFGGGATPVDASPRERAIFWTYGVLAFVFSYWFLASVVLGIGGWLVWRWQAAGFAMFAVLVALVFPLPVRRLLGARWFATGIAPAPPVAPVAPSPPATNGANGTSGSHGTNGSHPPGDDPTPPKRDDVPISARRRRAGWVALAASLAVLAWVVRVPLRVAGAFELLPAQNADVPATIDGVVERVYVREGQVVRAGDTLARLSEHEHRARLRALEADVAERRARLGLLEAGTRPEELELARLAVTRMAEPLRVARAEARRIASLAAKNLATPAELERAEEQAAVLGNELLQARERLAMLRAGNRKEEIAAMAQAVAQAEAERSRLEAEIGRLVVLAPHPGVVTTPRMAEKVGRYLRPGDLVAEVLEVERVTAAIDVSERDIGEVHVGQPVALRLRAYPDRTLRGRVARIAPAAADTGWREQRTIRVEVDLPNSDRTLRPAMTGWARIDTGDRRMAEVLTRRIRRYIRVEFWSWW